MSAIDRLEELIREGMRGKDRQAEVLALLEQERGLRRDLVPVLAALRQDGPCSARRIGQLTGTLAGGVSHRRLRELERRGLVGRIRRGQWRPPDWWITPAGAAMLARAEGA